jgi:hypothetical protein
MKFTQVAADAFQNLQLNAGMILTDFNPSNPGTASAIKGNALVATSGGATFQSNPTYTDFGDDIDNVPANTKQLKRIDHYEPRISGTGKTANPAALEAFLGAFTKTTSSGVDKYVPNPELATSDFRDIWWVGDYSDNNGNTNGGFIAIRLMDALNTGGFQLKSNDKGKGDLAFDFLGHYDIDDVDTVPFEVYAMAGSAEPGTDATLASLTLGSLTLSPTFDKDVTSYTATTTDSTNTITATATDSSSATVTIKNGSTTVTSGNAASWSAGKNTVTITVTNTHATKVYTVEVTKS